MIRRGNLVTIFLTLLTIIIESESRGRQWLCPPSYPVCNCNTRDTIFVTADCHNRHLRSIPKFEQKFQRLKFSQNILLNLNNNTFVNIRSWPITELFINKCNIKTVMEDTFKDLQLDFIDFSENRDINITQLAKCFQNLNLKGLDLSGIALDSSIVVDFFNNKASSSLTFLRMASCKLTSLDKSMFKHLQNLKDIDLSKNNIRFIDLLTLPPVNSLTIRNIGLSELPYFNNSRTTHLRHLDVGYNIINDISTFMEYGHLFESLESLYIDSNPLKELPLETFSSLKSLQNLSMCNVTTILLSFVGIKSVSITNLNISYNTLKPTYAIQYFNQSRNITNLKMEHTSLSKWSVEDIFNLFSPLCDSLVELKMMGTYFQSIPSKALRCFKKLDNLNLSSNNISGWNSDENPFENVTVRKRLFLKDNLIQIINETSFPRSYMFTNRPRFINFHGNPFSCTCKAHWFRNWMRENYYRLGGPFGDNILCKSPDKWKDIKFTQYDPYYEDCYGMGLAEIVGLTLCCVCIIGITILLYFVNSFCKRYKDRHAYTVIK